MEGGEIEMWKAKKVDDVKEEVKDEEMQEELVIEEEPGSPSIPLVFIMPTINYTIGKGFSDTELQYNSTLKQWEIHKGIDLLTANSEQIYAVQDGIVNSVETSFSQGTFFSITHSAELKFLMLFCSFSLFLPHFISFCFNI